MNKGKKPDQPSAPLGAVPPSEADGQSQFKEKYRIFSGFCQGPQVPNQAGEHRLSPGAADTIFHAFLPDTIRYLAAHNVELGIAEQVTIATRRSLLKATKRHRVNSAEGALEFIAEALLGRVAGLQIFPVVIKQVAAESKIYAKRFLGSAANAEDALQQALLLVHQNPGKFDAFTQEQAMGVLRGIARNMQCAEIRSQQRVILTGGEELAQQGVTTAADNDIETKQIAALLESQALRKVRTAIEFQDRKAESEELNRTEIERASRAREDVATILEANGVDTRHVYRRRRHRDALRIPLVEGGFLSPLPGNENGKPQSMPVTDSVEVVSDVPTAPTSQVRRRS